LRHPPTGLIVIAEESRSQHENRAKALGRLRKALFLELRDPSAAGQHPEWRAAVNGDGRVVVGQRDLRFWPAVGVALDALAAHEGRVSEAAEALGISTGNLVAFLQVDPKAWQQANVLRAKFGQKPLKA